jgi:hypothetical protein
MLKPKSPPIFEAQLVDYLINEYFEKDVNGFVNSSGYTKQQIEAWRSGKRRPRKATVRWLLSSTIAPEFRIVSEFAKVDIDSASEIRSQLKSALRGNHDCAGVYAFYDSMCNLFYLGKASTNLLGEMYQQLRCNLGVKFPNAITAAPKQRWQAVRYISAYEIPYVVHLDYPKHVEALILRLSKPVSNKVLGTLQHSVPPDD